MDKESFRKNGYALVDWIADYFTDVENYPVMSQLDPGDITGQLPQDPPAEGESMEKIFADFEDIVMPGISHWQHPSWFGYFPSNNSPPSVLAELLTAGVGAQCMVWQTSPAAAEMEEVVLEWLRKMLGLPEGMEGVIQDTASTATLSALLTAREVATNFETNNKGVRKPLVVYASEEAHSSIEKGVKIAGFGKENLRYIPTDDEFALLPLALEEQIKKDRENGFIPACVIATLGTTSSTAFDPLEKIGEICRRNNLWFHVDAAFAGSAAILEEERGMLKGMEYADSFVFNPHKWLFTNFDCSAFFVKNSELLKKTFEITPEYLKTSKDSEVNNYRDWGIQLGRRFRALKLWFVIRSYGVEGLRNMVKEHLRLAKLFEAWVAEDDRFEVLAPVNVSLVCFRFAPEGLPEKDFDELNRKLMAEVNSTGKVLLTHTSLKGKYAIRMCIGQRTTEEKHVRNAWELIKEKAAEMA